uniref:Kazal-like domain-containing protein n=1 Tax=Chelydra serpentina TaxID=8475 RepID=A0A8C3SMV4_CHESE
MQLGLGFLPWAQASLMLVLLGGPPGTCLQPPQANDCSAYQEPPKGQPLLCMKEYSPVCGTNGVMYDNKCLLCAAKWETGGELSLQHEGVCMKKVNPSVFYFSFT